MLRTASGMISAGGITCSKYFCLESSRSRHCRRSPSCPYEALIVGRPRAWVKLFTVSEATPDLVVSSIKCGVCFFSILSAYLLQTAKSNPDDVYYRWPGDQYQLTCFQQNLGIRFIGLNRFDLHGQAIAGILLQVGKDNLYCLRGGLIVHLIYENFSENGLRGALVQGHNISFTIIVCTINKLWPTQPNPTPHPTQPLST